jgi:hypothetical protein
MNLEYTEIAECFGSDATAGGIRFQFSTTFKQNAKKINDARAKGMDCKDLVFAGSGGSASGG